MPTRFTNSSIPITKLTDANGNVYSVEERDDGTIIQIKVDPALTFVTTPPSTIALGETLTIDLQLKDFDGEIRTDTRPVLFIMLSKSSIP